MPMSGPPTIEGIYDAYICVRDKKTQGTDGGTFTTGAWRTRDINEELADTANICSIASNQITLEAGTYRFNIRCYSHYVSLDQVRLYNTTTSAVILYGISGHAGGVGQTSHCAGRFTLAAQSVLEVQHYCYSTRATDGFGDACNWGDEIYTIAEFWREA